MKKSFTSLLLIFTSIVCVSMVSSDDSILAIIKSSTSDSFKVKNYTYLIEKYNNHPEAGQKARSYYEAAFSIATKSTLASSRAELLNYYGKYLRTINEYDSALYYHQLAYNLSQKIGYKKLEAKCGNNIGNVLNNQGKYAEAISAYIPALKIFDSLGMKKEASSLMMGIGNVYADNHNPEKALDYYYQSMAIKKDLKDDNGIVNNQINIGGIYYDLGNTKKALEVFAEAYTKAKEMDNFKALKTASNNIGECYGKLGDFDKALEYFFVSLALKKEDNDMEEISVSQLNIGDAYSAKKDYTKAQIYYDSVVTIGRELNSKEILVYVYQAMAGNYADQGNMGKAYEYSLLAFENKDTLLNSENFEKLAEVETKYQSEKKDLKIAKDALELKKKETYIYLLIGITALLLLGAWFFYYTVKVQKQKEMAAQLVVQQELRHKAIIEAEEKERVRIARDLHDGVGQLLSAVKMNLSALEVSRKEIHEKQKINNIIGMVDEGVKEVRSVSHSLVPNALIKQGLVSAIRSFINSLANTIKIELEIVGLQNKMEENIEIALYRALQEIINNIIKHSKATNVTIQLIEHNQVISLMVEDNGIGFDTTNLSVYEGIGLKNIVSRIEYVYGKVDFDSYIGKGTTVVIEVPLV